MTQLDLVIVGAGGFGREVLGYAEDAFAKNLPAEAKFGFLPKPFSLKQLATTVKDVLES